MEPAGGGATSVGMGVAVGFEVRGFDEVGAVLAGATDGVVLPPPCVAADVKVVGDEGGVDVSGAGPATPQPASAAPNEKSRTAMAVGRPRRDRRRFISTSGSTGWRIDRLVRRRDARVVD